MLSRTIQTTRECNSVGMRESSQVVEQSLNVPNNWISSDGLEVNVIVDSVRVSGWVRDS